MQIDLKKLMDEDEISFAYELSMSEITFRGIKPISELLSVSGKVQSHLGIITVSYAVKFIIHNLCDRCLEEWDSEKQMSFVHSILRQEENGDENDKYIVVKDDTLMLDDIVIADVFLEFPSKTLCKEDCKGLCQKCGKNLNVGDCKCGKKEIDPRLAVLQKLL